MFLLLLGFRAKIWYFEPDNTSGTMTKGAKLGTSKSLPYSGITQHIHITLYKDGKIVNPTPYL
jgi:major membrane immunogen (membrane-anchored lipoprotein)